METASLSLIRRAGQIPLGKSFDIIGVNCPPLPPGPLFLGLRSSVQRCRSHQCQLVMVKYVRLGSADVGVDPWRAIGAVAQEELPDKPAAAEGAQEPTPGWSQYFNHRSSPPTTPESS